MATTLQSLDTEDRLLEAFKRKTAPVELPVIEVPASPVVEAPVEKQTDQPTAEELVDLQAAEIGNTSPTPEELQDLQSPDNIDPLIDMTAEEIADLEINDPEGFNVRRAYMSRPDLIGNPGIIKKAAEANRLVRARNEPPAFALTGLPENLKLGARVVTAGQGLISTAKRARPIKAAFDFAKGVVKYAANSVVGAASPFVPQETREDYRRRAAENLAASELAIKGLVTGAKAGVEKVAQITGLEKPFSEYDSREVTDLFFSDLAKEAERERVAKGKGLVTTQLGGEVIKELEAAGKPIRPEEVSEIAAGDPFTFYAFTKAFGATGGLVPKEARAVANTAGRWVGEVSKDITGTALEGIGAGARGVASGINLLSRVPRAAGIPLAPLVGGTVRLGARVAEPVGRRIQQIGREMVDGEITLPSAQLLTDVVQATPAVTANIGTGVGFDIGTAAAMAEFPEEEFGSVGIGAAFGLMGATRHVLGRVVSGQEIAPRAWGGRNQIATSGPFRGSEFDQIHNTAYQAAPPAIRQRVNAVREFLRKAVPGVDLFYVPDTASFETALINQGVTPENARLWSSQAGLFVRELNGRPVAFAVDIDAAPHESFHPFQDVIGRTANDLLNEQVKKAYTAEEFEQIAQQYASRLGWDGQGNWRDFINEVTGDGYHAAIEKLSQEAANVIKLSTGNEPTAADARAEGTKMFNEAFSEASRNNPELDAETLRRNVWRGLLTEAEQKAVAERYAANELSAETWDAVFKHTGPSLKDPKGLIPKFSRVVANLFKKMGVDPLSGRVSQTGDLPLRRGAVEAVREAARARTETPPVIGGGAATPVVTPRTPTRPVVLPSGATTPTTPQDRTVVAEETRRIAQDASDEPVAGGTRSERELLGEIAVAQAAGEAVKLNYLSAPDEPAAAISSNRTVRRQIIEMFRSMPQAARALWEKNFFPERVRRTQRGRIQVGGWAPEVFAANAHKTADALTRLDPGLSPYPLDATTRSFTEEGWRQLYEDVQIFVQNQMAGRTGSGDPLVVPRSMEQAGFFKPPEQTGAGSLDQRKADFISAMFGMKLPDTPRIQRGRTPLNIAGQEVSEATIPGRTEPPTRPRAPYGEPFAGREILEVNPWRAEFERAAQQAGVDLPSTIEAFQWLNMENIREVSHSPEQPQFRGNTLTLQAGFQPKPNDPRAVKEAAVRDPETGKVFTGLFHAFAIEKLEASLGIEPGTYFSGEDGFVTNSGEFLTRTEALERAVKIKQLSKEDADLIGSEAGYDEGPGLESEMFDSRRQFQPSPKKEIELTGPDGLIKGTFGKSTVPFEPISTLTLQAGFQPKPNDPRAIKEAAVRDAEGKIYTGRWHGEASDKALSSGSKTVDEDGNFSGEQGFVTNEGEFLDRDQAFNRARELKQISKRDERPFLPLEEGEKAYLEAVQFENVRAFQPQAKKEIELIGPDGKKYKARFDGYWDLTAMGRGHVAALTALEDLPGALTKLSSGMAPTLEKAGYKLPTDLPPPETDVQFQPKVKEEPRVGLEFKKFFSDVTKGTFGKSTVPFEPISDLSGKEAVVETKTKHSGNFDDHIAKSIPTFYETQIKKASAIAEVYNETGARVLDIAASEGSFGKTISELTDGRVETVSLDPNPDMAAFFESKSKVPGATYSEESFLTGFEDAGRTYPSHDPAQPYDVITEAMGFQFIDPDRGPQIEEVKRLLKPDGVFLTEQKVRNPEWAANEKKKDDEYKAKYFSGDELKQKDTRVGFSQAKDEAKSVGMVDNMADQTALEKVLTDNFEHVVQYWDSGNFKGYAAGDDAAKVNQLVRAMGNTVSDFSTVNLPREVAFAPNADIQRVRKEFQDEEGIIPPTRPITMRFNEDIAKEISDFYDAAPKNTVTPEARKSYDAFNAETKRQYQKLVDAGYVLEPWKGEGAPYPDSAALRKDLADNKHLFYLPSETAIGEGPAPKDIKNYPPLEDSGVTINGERVPFNDLFRAVHDTFGHGTEGRTFSMDGEFQAWQDHARMYSEEAQSALALETLGQNAWFNAGAHLRRPDGTLPKKGDADFIPLHDRGYAPRTIFEFPKELMDRAVSAQFSPRKRKEVDPLKFLGTQHGSASKAWILPNGKVEQLGAQWHHDWLDQNPEVQKKYGLKIPAFEGTDSEGVREAAVKKGFARVNLDNGVLVVEVREKDWRNIRPIVEDLIEKNLDDIDRFRVGLLNDTATDLRKTYSDKLFDADSNKEKMSRVFDAFSDVAQTEGGAAFQPNYKERLKQLKKQSQEDPIIGAAVKNTETGETFTGSIHPVIWLDIAKKQGSVDPRDFVDGFVTKSGKFLDREQAFSQAIFSEQLKETGLSKMAKNLGQLEAREFEKKRQFQPKKLEEQEQLFGGREYVSPANLTQEELRVRYPEAIVPRNSKEKIASNIVGSPLYKKSDNPVQAFADKLVEFANQHKDNPTYQLGLRWYSDFAPLLKKEFGKDAPMMAELLAASSPNEKPDQNFYYAVDAMEGFKSGRFDKIVEKFNQGFEMYKSDKWLNWYNKELNSGNIPNPPKNPTPEAFLAHWIYKHNLKPRQSNGQLFGFHGRAILEVMARKWLDQNEGPKVANFVQNLQGTGHEATIDVWADRTMRRVGYEGAKDRWRILPANGEGVSDADFAFSQKAFRRAAEQLGIEPDALQGGLWFAEKQLWADNGWGRLDLGSYVNEMEKLPMIRQAIKQRLSATEKRAKVKPMKSGELQFQPGRELDEKVFNFLEARDKPINYIEHLRNGRNFGVDREFSKDEANELFRRYLLNPKASYSPKEGEAWKKNIADDVQPRPTL